MTSRSRRRLRRALLPVAAVAVAAVAARAWLQNWGSTAAERSAVLPGDEVLAGPATSVTRGISIAAPAERVWPWLVQIGQDRGGWYTYERLENLFGLEIHNADEVRPEWQHLAVGDRVVQVPTGWPLLPAGYSMPVARLDPGRAVVLRQSPPEHPWDATWAFVIAPVDSLSSRLLTRSRTTVPASPGAQVTARVSSLGMDPVIGFMERGMLRGIKARAERPAPTA